MNAIAKQCIAEIALMNVNIILHNFCAAMNHGMYINYITGTAMLVNTMPSALYKYSVNA